MSDKQCADALLKQLEQQQKLNVALSEAVHEFAGFFSSDNPKHWELHRLACGEIPAEEASE